MRLFARAWRLSGAGWGIPLAIFPFALWFSLAWWINPDHVYGTFIRKEIVDRVLGIGDDPASSHSLWDFVITLPAMPGTFIIRYFPWTIFFIGALVDLFGKKRCDRKRGLPDMALDRDDHQKVDQYDRALTLRIWLISAIVSTIVPIVFFSFSIGKRGDYIAASFIPASILVAYWFNHLGLQLACKRPRLVPILAMVTIAVLGYCAFTINLPARYPLGESLWEFAKTVRPVIDDTTNPLPVEFYRTGRNPIQSLLYRSQIDHAEVSARRLQEEKPFYLFVRSKYLDEFKNQTQISHWQMSKIAQSRPAAGSPNSKPYQVFLYRMTPKG